MKPGMLDIKIKSNFNTVRAALVLAGYTRVGYSHSKPDGNDAVLIKEKGGSNGGRYKSVSVRLQSTSELPETTFVALKFVDSDEELESLNSLVKQLRADSEWVMIHGD